MRRKKINSDNQIFFIFLHSSAIIINYEKFMHEIIHINMYFFSDRSKKFSIKIMLHVQYQHKYDMETINNKKNMSFQAKTIISS